MILWLICIEDGVTEEYHPVTRNHEWQKFGACFTNTLPNEEKCKSTASFGNLDSFSRQWQKAEVCVGEQLKNKASVILLLEYAKCLCWYLYDKTSKGTKNSYPGK